TTATTATAGSTASGPRTGVIAAATHERRRAERNCLGPSHGPHADDRQQSACRRKVREIALPRLVMPRRRCRSSLGNSVTHPEMSRRAGNRAVRPLDFDESVATLLERSHIMDDLARSCVDDIARIADVDEVAIARM